MKKLFWLITLALFIIGVGLWLWPRHETTPADGRLSVVATFYPLAYLATAVGGDYTQVTTIIPAGVEPHDYSPSPQDVLMMTQAQVLIYNGAGLDNWAGEIPLSDFAQLDVRRIEAVTLVPRLDVAEADLDHHLADTQDPHIWLDPNNLKLVVEQIVVAYVQADPDHATTYQANGVALLERLTALDQNYQTTLAHCQLDTAIVAHDAFSYLANRYGLNLIPIVGLNPQETPSARTLAELAVLAETEHIDYIFFEELTSPRLSEVLAEQVGAQTLVLNPLEGLSADQQAQGVDYFSVMQQNLDHLSLALQCER